MRRAMFMSATMLLACGANNDLDGPAFPETPAAPSPVSPPPAAAPTASAGPPTSPAPNAAAPGDDVLAQMDAATSSAKTLQLDYEVTNKEAGKEETKLGLRATSQGEKRVVEFTAPASMKGTKLLVASPQQLYVYLPAFGKVRRIPSHSKDRGFLGLAFSQDDLAAAPFSSQYSATIRAEDAATWTLTLTPKSGQEPAYARIDITVTKDKKLPTELRYFDGAGANIETETRSSYSCERDACTPGEIKTVDGKSGAWTKLVVKSRKVDAPIADDMFSPRALGQ